jgi:hypothetical protein
MTLSIVKRNLSSLKYHLASKIQRSSKTLRALKSFSVRSDGLSIAATLPLQEHILKLSHLPPHLQLSPYGQAHNGTLVL